MPRVIAPPLHDEFAERLGAHIVDDGVRRVLDPQPALDHQRFDECFVHGDVRGDVGKDFAEGDQFSQPWDFETELML